MGTISKNFSYREFERSQTADSLHINNSITSAEVRDSIKSLVENVLQPLRDIWGFDMVVNSGYRCPELNRAVGGVPTSQHTKGEAADIACKNPIDLARLIVRLDLPFDQIVFYPWGLHISHKRVGVQRRQVCYNRTYRGERL